MAQTDLDLDLDLHFMTSIIIILNHIDLWVIVSDFVLFCEKLKIILNYSKNTNILVFFYIINLDLNL